MQLYVVRHGETDWNKSNKVLGRTDIPLNEAGKKQAHLLALRLHDSRIDTIISSPLSRACETAQIILQSHQTPIEFIVDDRLIEQNFGIYEGVSRSDKTYQAAKRNYFVRYPQGESFLDMVGRIYPFINELKARYSDRKVMLVTHNGICRIITSYFRNMDNEEFVTFAMNNTEVEEFVL